jgi:hypothetical protein
MGCHRPRPQPIVSALVGALAGTLLGAPFAVPAAADEVFTDRAAAAGLDFVHFNGMTGSYTIAEVTGAGGALLDYDNDGDLDLYLVQGNLLAPESEASRAVFPPPGPLPLGDRLFRNDLEIRADGSRSLRLVDVTAASGIEGIEYGMGAATGDFDNDGWTDLYVTNFGPNRLWRNDGDGTFTDVTGPSGAGERRWSAPATFFDFDGDGWLDLFVGNYLAYTVGQNRACIGETGVRDYCGPQSYQPEPDLLLRNRGDGTFADVTASSGLAEEYGPALGAIATDLDGDGRTDLYVANDQAPNQLWLNRGDGSFVNEALLSGSAVNREGQMEASMGVDAADIDDDGDEDLVLAHLSRESNTLYVNDGSGLFHDRSLESGLGNPSWRATAFGAAWIDYDNDGRLDLFTANGAVYIQFELDRDNDPYPLHQTNQLFRGVGDGRFEEVSAAAGPELERSEVSRGALFGDLDNDGDTDIVLNNNSGPARLLINNVGSGAGWLGLRLVADTVSRYQPGAKVAVQPVASEARLWRRPRTDGSFGSARDPRLIVGLGAATGAGRVEARWPGGRVEVWRDLGAGRYLTLFGGAGGR